MPGLSVFVGTRRACGQAVRLADVAHLEPDQTEAAVFVWTDYALGHTFGTPATLDLDLALALSSWDLYRTHEHLPKGRTSPDRATVPT